MDQAFPSAVDHLQWGHSDHTGRMVVHGQTGADKQQIYNSHYDSTRSYIRIRNSRKIIATSIISLKFMGHVI